MFLIPMFCYVGVEMSVRAVCERARQTFIQCVSRGFLAREPGPLTSWTAVAVRMRRFYVAFVKLVILLMAVHGHQ